MQGKDIIWCSKRLAKLAYIFVIISTCPPVPMQTMQPPRSDETAAHFAVLGFQSLELATSHLSESTLGHCNFVSNLEASVLGGKI